VATSSWRAPPLPPRHHIALRSPGHMSNLAPPDFNTRAGGERRRLFAFPFLFLFSYVMQFSVF
jgi:hypothetical protein